MAYDEGLVERLRAATRDEAGMSEKRMFGGISFLVGGRLAVSASGKGDLMVRVGTDRLDELLAEPGVSPMMMGARPMKGWVRVDPVIVRSEADLDVWVRRGLAHARSLPPA